MQPLLVRGHTITSLSAKNISSRKVVQITNQIVSLLSQLGVVEDDVEVQSERVAVKRCPAEVSFWLSGQHCHFSYHQCVTFAENLWVVFKVLEAEVLQVLSEELSLDEFVYSFSEKTDVAALRKEAREVLGVSEDCFDFSLIHKNYKALSKKYHPDMPGGDHERFSEINKAHKVLKKELE
ncbi:MAG: J domain-containing protein [Candidatus Woesearchaeota archaeon]